MINDKRIRQLVIVVLLVALALGLLSLASTVFQLIVPLALAAIGGFAFYKIAIEGRDSGDAMRDEIAEASAVDPDSQFHAGAYLDEKADETETEAPSRLSAMEQAQRRFLDETTPAQEILDQIKARKQRLSGEDEA